MRTNGALIDQTGRTWLRFSNALESHGAIVADGEVVEMPGEARMRFAEFGRRVTHLEFSAFDECDDSVGGFDLYVVYDSEEELLHVIDVQFIDGKISFRLLSPLN
jgi:hypothetical protein